MKLTLHITARRGDFHLSVDERVDDAPLAVFGHSGAGKTTLLRCIAGLVKPESGCIAVGDTLLFDSEAGIHLPPEKRRVGYVPQDGLLFPHMSARQNLLYGYSRIPSADRKIRPEEVYAVLGIEDLLERRPTQLSGGEAQRVALGRALLSHPQLLLFDEPLAAVDRRRSRIILPYLVRAIEHFNIPAIYVSHQHEEVTAIARTMLVLRNGSSLACGNYSTIINDPSVYGEFSREGVDAPLRGTIEATDQQKGFSIIRCGSARLRIPPLEAPDNSQVMLTINAGDVILATSEPKNISTRNILSGRITRLANVGSLMIVHIDVGCELMAELTQNAVDELQLAKGSRVWALVKTNAIRITAGPWQSE